MKKKQKQENVKLDELIALIIAVVERMDRKKIEDAEEYIESEAFQQEEASVPRYVYHVMPHCDGCTCKDVDGIRTSTSSSYKFGDVPISPISCCANANPDETIYYGNGGTNHCHPK